MTRFEEFGPELKDWFPLLRGDGHLFMGGRRSKSVLDGEEPAFEGGAPLAVVVFALASPEQDGS